MTKYVAFYFMLVIHIALALEYDCIYHAIDYAGKCLDYTDCTKLCCGANYLCHSVTSGQSCIPKNMDIATHISMASVTMGAMALWLVFFLSGIIFGPKLWEKFCSRFTSKRHNSIVPS